MRNVAVLIMAAGKGTRMTSNHPKVLHALCGVPMVRLIYESAAALSPEEVFVIIGQEAERVRGCLDGFPAHFVLQSQQLGTGHAVMVAREFLERRQGDLLVLFGDTPRIKTETLRKLVEHHQQSGADTTLLTVYAANPFGYGRILRGSDTQIEAIVEEKDASPEQRLIREINPGFYCFKIVPLLEALSRITNENSQREYYVTDVIGIQKQAGYKLSTILHDDYEELRGINTQRQLAELSRALGREKNSDLMAAGVTLMDPDSTPVDLDVFVDKGVTLYPRVTLEGKARILEGSIVRSGTRITNSTIGPEAEILDSCLIVDSQVGRRSTIGPSTYIREHTTIGDDCRIGSFVEINATSVGDGSTVAHSACLSNAVIGQGVRIGAGSVTCQESGLPGSTVIVEDRVVVGAGTQLIAPVRIGQGAHVAAGSRVTKDLPPGAGSAPSRVQVTERLEPDR